MADKKQKRGLGRGLGALMDDIGGAAAAATAPASLSTDDAPRGVRTAPIEMIRPNPGQPRKTFPPSEMDDLANSIREKGVLQPILVRPDADNPGGFSIVAGERRWRAAQMAQVHEIPIIVREMSDEETLEVAIIENVQRSDLNPVEEALGYQELINAFGHSQAALAQIIGKSRPYIANALRLLSLPEYVQDLLSKGSITAGHARALVTANEPSVLARKIVEEGLTVRQAEDLARTLATSKAPKPGRPSRKDADTSLLEADLAAALGLKVVINHKGDSGSVTLSYKSLDELDGLCQLLMK